MDEKSFSEAVSLLSGEHSLSILRYLAGGEWRIASDVSRSLHIHTTTASKFLGGMHALGFLDHEARGDEETGWVLLGLREAMDFYLAYVSNVLERGRRLGWPAIADKLEARLARDRTGSKEELFSRLLRGEGARGMEELRSMFQGIQREFLAITAASMGTDTAHRLLSGAADEARKGHEDVVERYGLRKVLEA